MGCTTRKWISLTVFYFYTEHSSCSILGGCTLLLQLLQWSSSDPALTVSQAVPLDGMWKLGHSRGNPIIINCQRSPTGTSACCCCCCYCVGFVSIGCWWIDGISCITREREIGILVPLWLKYNRSFAAHVRGLQWTRNRKQHFNKPCFHIFTLAVRNNLLPICLLFTHLLYMQISGCTLTAENWSLKSCLRGSSRGGPFLILTTQGWFGFCHPNTNKRLGTPLENEA